MYVPYDMFVFLLIIYMLIAREWLFKLFLQLFYVAIQASQFAVLRVDVLTIDNSSLDVGFNKF